MLNETNSELQERSDKDAADEMMIRTDIQLPAPIYHRDFVDAYELMYDDYVYHMEAVKQAIEDQQRIEATDWNDRHGY